ncbi:MAG: TIGR00296 family protein [Candidatus Woesearchaeota archaeon]|jgi:hypothetical protein|nr:TIGR00296 family protein [Candidatus Woesearchaeota archaeon]
MFTLEQGKELIKLARDSIEGFFSSKNPVVGDNIKKLFSDKMGVFVTLNLGGELRGCIGIVEPTKTLYDGIISAARSAAFSDPRFPKLSIEEFAKLAIEVSILTRPKLMEVRNPLDLVNNVHVGKDGLMIVGTFHQGLLLPQVAVEHHWDATMFLDQTCVKAGLPAGTWKDFNACRVYKFQGQVFSEKSPNGEVVQLL